MKQTCTSVLALLLTLIMLAGVSAQDASHVATTVDGMNGTVLALAVDDAGNLYAGGGFTEAGGVPANNVAVWNGSAWDSLGSGVNGAVNALAIDGDGNLYAAGSFTEAGGLSAARVAKWDTTSKAWSALGTGTNGTVNALAVAIDGNLYATGAFTMAGGVSANYVAEWDTTSATWSAVGTGVTSEVYSLALDTNGDLYAGGISLSKWDGSSWTDAGDSFFYAFSLAFDENRNLYVGVGLHAASGPALGFRDRGSGLWLYSEPFDDYIWALADGNRSLHDMYLGGYFNEVDLQGTRRRVAQASATAVYPVGSGANSAVLALAVSGNGDLYAGGAFTVIGGVAANRVARWDGACWCAIGFDCAALHVKAFLEGPYTGPGMHTALNTNGHLPSSQPFSDPIFDGTAMDFDSLLSITPLPDSTVDWVLVSLRTGTDAATEVPGSEHAALLHDTGSITSVGEDSLRFKGVSDGSYNLVIRARNHVDVMSAAPVTITNGSGSYDFTTSAGQAYGTGAQKMLATGVWGLHAGEANMDDTIQALDFDAFLTQYAAEQPGYLIADFDLNGLVGVDDAGLFFANTAVGAVSHVP